MHNIQFKTKTTTEWGNSEYILPKGSIGIDSDKNEIRIGNGVDLWKNLKSVNNIEINTYDNWINSKTIPDAGKILMISDRNGYVKIGDGINNFSNLPCIPKFKIIQNDDIVLNEGEIAIDYDGNIRFGNYMQSIETLGEFISELYEWYHEIYPQDYLECAINCNNIIYGTDDELKTLNNAHSYNGSLKCHDVFIYNTDYPNGLKFSHPTEVHEYKYDTIKNILPAFNFIPKYGEYKDTAKTVFDGYNLRSHIFPDLDIYKNPIIGGNTIVSNNIESYNDEPRSHTKFVLTQIYDKIYLDTGDGHEDLYYRFTGAAANHMFIGSRIYSTLNDRSHLGYSAVVTDKYTDETGTYYKITGSIVDYIVKDELDELNHDVQTTKYIYHNSDCTILIEIEELNDAFNMYSDGLSMPSDHWLLNALPNPYYFNLGNSKTASTGFTYGDNNDIINSITIGNNNKRNFSDNVNSENFRTSNDPLGPQIYIFGDRNNITNALAKKYIFGDGNIYNQYSDFDTDEAIYYPKPEYIFGQYFEQLDESSYIISKTKDTQPLIYIGNGSIEEYNRPGSSGTEIIKSNALILDYSGNLQLEGKVASTGSDFGEYGEWEDGNPNNEDRIGYFITLVGTKMKIASSTDKIFGAITGRACFVGNSYIDHWNQKYLKDKYGRIIYEEIKDEEGKIINIVKKLNPEYDPKQGYISREHRQEYDIFGFHGRLIVNDDGTCEVGKYCKCNDDGIATNDDSNNGYYVMDRIDDTTIEIFFG